MAAESGEHLKGLGGASGAPNISGNRSGGRKRGLAEVNGRGNAVLVGERDVEIVEKPEEVKPVPMKWVYKIKPDSFGKWSNISLAWWPKAAAGVRARRTRDGLPPQAHLVRIALGSAARHTRLKEELGNFEFVASFAVAALFLAVVNGVRVYLIMWIDDILIGAQCRERIARVKAPLAEKFDGRDFWEATYFFGMDLSRDAKARIIKLTQKKLTGDLLARHGLAGARVRSVLLATGKSLTKEGAPLDMAKFPVASFFSVCVTSACSHGLISPRPWEHWRATQARQRRHTGRRRSWCATWPEPDNLWGERRGS
ncbi:Transposon-encoded protein with Ribonuclease H-like superfamily and reverse transcriptase domain and integrase domain [Klebsormidium nitens]|uniref:Transposon-encoded protein with Ribonuclease H-like superfamily and reverse transcriptase domain and integrase domain n=1 Tax=Klebsormidium nitens TaxID=105231 RepID=A0A1Y1IMY0_KLENI|nr:Transposon-encoded protein with Ribonuclease H-like superfamily and reverse transcriptase domain and integrase domain [Klebsormidium nitens]|eukprot:GAQ92265.1 Transposon-encoded protein with Ribonuclease H-like superfamily and reverse transcriptase domain and integrase domain [Klebsormidium nitens]